MENYLTPNPGNAPVDSFLQEKLLNPEYMFNLLSDLISRVFHIIFNNTTKEIIDTIIFYLALFFVSIIVYVTVRMLEIRAKEHKHVHHEVEEYKHEQQETEKKLKNEKSRSKNERWTKVVNYLFSQSSSDWKLSIMEADSMLMELMGQLGFSGSTLGDRLKSASQESFPQLATAWEVHAIRNKIAHEGLAFELSQHEAKRVIALYESIFHVYGFI